MQQQTSMHDPVCGMPVTSLDHVIEYQGIRFAFCSEQCRARFIANPHLYIGQPGSQPAPKQEGKEIIKKRCMHLSQPLAAKDRETLITSLREMMGVKSVTIENNRVEIVYDLLQATAEQIEDRLTEIGIQLGSGWAEHLQRAFIHYTEECEVQNLEVREGHIPH